MSGIVNLESALRTCKVDTGYSSRIQSDRFLNPRNLVCPVWNGLDTAGRLACADSFKTKREGCNSAEDRVGVEKLCFQTSIYDLHLYANCRRCLQ